jgi:ATP-dependent DNA helicase PIF1
VQFLFLKPAQRNKPILSLVDSLYGDTERRFMEPNYFAQRMILTPINGAAQEINEEVIQKLPGDIQEYLLIDAVEKQENMEHGIYPAEFLNMLTISGMPTRKLCLKVGTLIILRRNISGKQGLCSGTSLKVCRLAPNSIDAIIMMGNQRGKKVFIPRITLISHDSGLPLQLCRRHYTVQVAFAMMINKAQGQSVHYLGFYLPQHVFAHGQLYVALSRVTSRSSRRLLLQEEDHQEKIAFALRMLSVRK